MIRKFELSEMFMKYYRALRSYTKDPTIYYTDCARQRRLLVSKAQWRHNADSPVNLMIDDFTNAWFDANGNGCLDPGEDWGGRHDEPGSVFDFLKRALLSHFPGMKITFFTVMGPMSPFHLDTPFTSALPINHSRESNNFFKKIHFNKSFEIAYHGYDHGTPGTAERKFSQEWELVSSAEQSLKKINKGISIFEDVFGEMPKGGKTGAYIMNECIEESIDTAGFFWWCRDWTNKRLEKKANYLLYEPKFFGKNQVVDIPSTVHGGRWFRRQIRNLLRDRQVITIQEHISPYGVDGRRIYPNIIEDISELKALFAYLNKKNIWHATLSEIAEYIDAYTFTHIYDAGKDGFTIHYTGKLINPILSILIDPFSLSHAKPGGYLKITLPDQSILAAQQYIYDQQQDFYIVDLPVQEGRYQVEWGDASPPELTCSLNHNGCLHYNEIGCTGEITIKIPPDMNSAETRYFKYRNNGWECMAQYCDETNVAVFCVNSHPDDQLKELF